MPPSSLGPLRSGPLWLSALLAALRAALFSSIMRLADFAFAAPDAASASAAVASPESAFVTLLPVSRARRSCLRRRDADGPLPFVLWWPGWPARRVKPRLQPSGPQSKHSPAHQLHSYRGKRTRYYKKSAIGTAGGRPGLRSSSPERAGHVTGLAVVSSLRGVVALLVEVFSGVFLGRGCRFQVCKCGGSGVFACSQCLEPLQPGVLANLASRSL